MSNETKPADSLARAVAYLGAVEVDPGRYGYFDPRNERWCTFDSLTLTDAPLTTPGKLASWLRGTSERKSIEMPAWWTPERRYDVRGQGFSTTPFATLDLARIFVEALRPENVAHFDFAARIVTADLETGAEVTA